jgi:hypothetical protein
LRTVLLINFSNGEVLREGKLKAELALEEEVK